MISRNRLLGTALVSAANFAVLVPFARLGIDPHHDGIMLHPALMVSKGNIIHRDVFSQYGPLTTMVHSVAVHLFGEGLWAIRFASCLCLVGSQAMLFLINSRLFGIARAYLAGFVSLCLVYFLSSSAPMHPWPSDVLLLLTTGISLAFVAIAEVSRPFREVTLLVCIGLLASLTPFTRQASGVIVILILLVWFSVTRDRAARTALVSLVVGLSVWLAYFRVTNSWGAFVDQAVVGPWRWAFEERGSVGWSSVRGNLINQGVVGLAVIFALIKCLEWLVDDPMSENGRVQRQRMVAGASAISLLITLNQGAIPFINRESLLWIFATAAIVAVFMSCIAQAGTRVSWFEHHSMAKYSLFLPIVTIFPVTDIRHAYWAFVPLVGLGLDFLALQFKQRSALLAAGVMLCVALGYQALDAGRLALKVERVSVPSTPVLKHMLFDKEYFKYFESRFETIAEYRRRHPRVVVFNICSDGLFASLGSAERMPDPYFVSWSFGIDFFGASSEVAQRRVRFILDRRPIVWMCPLVENPQTLARQYRLRLLPNDESVPTNDQYGWWPYVSYLGVPVEWEEIPETLGRSG